MIVTARLFGTLRRFASEDSPGVWRGELPEGSTIRDVVLAMGAEETEVSGGALSGVLVPMDTSVPPEADLVLVTLIGGG